MHLHLPFRLKAPDEVQNTEGLFTVLNEFWATELADILLPRDQVSLGDPLYRGMCSCKKSWLC